MYVYMRIYLYICIHKVKSVSPEGFAFSTVQKLAGVLRAIREKMFVHEEVLPALTQTSTAYSDLLVVDQLGPIGLATLFNTFAHSYVKGEPKSPGEVNVPPKYKKENGTKYYHPNVLTISNSYPGIFTNVKPTPTEKELAFDCPRNRLLMRMFIGHLVRTGNPPVAEDPKAWMTMIDVNPRILWLWGKLKTIAEPAHRMAETALGLALMSEKSGFDAYTRHKDACQCTSMTCTCAIRMVLHG